MVSVALSTSLHTYIMAISRTGVPTGQGEVDCRRYCGRKVDGNQDSSDRHSTVRVAVWGKEGRYYNPDWFKENEVTLEPMFTRGNQFYVQGLNTGKIIDKQRFNQARRDARKAMRAAKNLWFQTKRNKVGLVGRLFGRRLKTCSMDGKV